VTRLTLKHDLSACSAVKLTRFGMFCAVHKRE
jgi:hypothetical protein